MDITASQVSAAVMRDARALRDRHLQGTVDRGALERIVALSLIAVGAETIAMRHGLEPAAELLYRAADGFAGGDHGR